MADLEEEMVASYEVAITGIKRTKAEMAKLDDEIRNLRAGRYSPNSKVGGASFKGSDIFVNKIDELEGRVQTSVQSSMLHAMDLGKEVQTKALRAATTATGASGRSHSKGGRVGGAGREDTGAMIKALARNVEVEKEQDTTYVTGWHGWREGREDYFEDQERGTRSNGGSEGGLGVHGRKRLVKKGGTGGVPAANSLGSAMPIVRETLKADLRKLR